MRKTQKRKRKQRRTLKSKKIGGSYDDRMKDYHNNMEHIELLQDDSICGAESISLQSTGKESLGVYDIVHANFKNIIYKKMSPIRVEGQQVANSEIRYSTILSKLVTDNVFPNFPIYYGHKFCEKYSMRFYEKATGDGAKWANDNKLHKNMKNKFISFLIQTAMIGIRLKHDETWIDDFKPENYLYLNVAESSDKYFHYRYHNGNDSYIDIYVYCAGELWLRSDFGYINPSKSRTVYTNTVSRTWEMYEVFKKNRMLQPNYKAINDIRDNPAVKKIYDNLITLFNDMTVLDRVDIFGEQLITVRPSEDLIINKQPYQLNY